MAAAGQLDRRARFERRATAPDGHGNERGDWATLSTVWASLRVPKPAEAIEGGAPRSRETAELRFRVSTAARMVTAADRVVIDGRAWRLLGDPVEHHPRSGMLTAMVEREA
jgi:head-tail adaptor